MADERIEIEIVLDDGSVKKGFATIQKSGQDSANAIEKSFSSLKGIIAGAAATIGGAFALHKIVEAGIESDRAWRGFGAALASTGQLSEVAFNSFESLAASLQKVTGIQDEVIASGGALLLNVGRLSTEALPAATKAALDLAAGLQKGPEVGFELLAKAATGAVTGLEKYGIRISAAIPESERFAAVLKLIENQFGGQASNAAKTFEGAMLRITNGFSDLVENLGTIVTRSPAAIALLTVLGDKLGLAGDKIKEFGKVKDPLKPMLESAVSFGEGFTKFVLQPLEMLGNAGAVIFSDVIAGLNAIAMLAGRAGQAVVMLLQTVGVEVGQKLVQDMNNFTEEAQTGLQNWFLAADSLATQINQTPMSDSLKEFNTELQNAVVNSADVANALTSNLTNATTTVETFSKSAKASIERFQSTVRSALGNSVASNVQAMTKALQAGESGWSVFGKAVLNIIGDMAIQIGTFAVLTGFEMISLTSNPFTAGFASVAAGIALIALGTLLKSGGGGGSAPIAPSGGGGGVTSEPTSAPDNSDQLQAAPPKTEVIVNIHGPILDRRETGLAIADIINESFDLNGTRITGVV